MWVTFGECSPMPVESAGSAALSECPARGKRWLPGMRWCSVLVPSSCRQMERLACHTSPATGGWIIAAIKVVF